MLKRFAALALGFALVFGATVPAHAASKAQIKEQKARVKMLSKEIKSFEKAKKKYLKAIDKGKSTTKLDATIKDICARNLGWLRGIHKVDNKTEETKANKWHVAMRDVLKDVKQSKDKKLKVKQMDKLSAMLQTRLERHEKKLDKMGG